MRGRAHVLRFPRSSLRWRMELLWSLMVYRVSLRYKETFFGLGWIFLQPIALTALFTYLFQRFASLPSAGVPYPLFVAAGLVPWSLTALAVSQSAHSITNNQAFLKRVALPRILLPLSAVLATLVDFGAMLTLLAGLLAYHRFSPSWMSGWILPLLGIHLLLLVGLGCLASLANVFLRDVGQAIPLLLQLWLFASPVFYGSSWVPEGVGALTRWNPMTGLIEGYRAVLFQGHSPSPDLMGPLVLVSAGIFAAGVACFQALEGTVADKL